MEHLKTLKNRVIPVIARDPALRDRVIGNPQDRRNRRIRRNRA